MSSTTPAPAVRTVRLQAGRPRTLLVAAAGGVVVAAVLAACGGGSAASTAASSGASTAASGPRTVTATGQAAAPGADGQDGDRGAELQKIQQCLTAAGISLPTPTGMPANGTPPAGGAGMTPGADGRYTAPDGDVYTAPPTRGDGDGGGPGGDGPGRMFSDPAVQAALKACGITVPTGGARPSASPTTTG